MISDEGWIIIGAVSTLLMNFLTLLAVSIREIVLTVKGSKRRTNGRSGEKSIEFWELKMSEIQKGAQLPLVEMLIRIERNQTEILRIMRNIRADQKNRDGIDSGDL
jgi:hypothetical protein